MKLKIVTPERVVLEEEVEAVYGRATDGSFGVMPNHLPMVTPLEIGVLHYTKNGQRVPVAVMGGLFRTDGKSATILSDAAEPASEIDTVRAEEAKKRAEARLREKNAHVDLQRAEMALSRSIARLKATSRG